MFMLMCLFLSVQEPPNSNPDELWAQANQAYQDEVYDDAIDHYESILAAGVENGRLHYNLGNAYYRDGKLGKAILHYHRARRLDPGDQDVLHNIAIANQHRQDPPIEGEDEGAGFERLMHTLPYSTVFFLAMTLLCLGGLASVWLVVKPESHKWVGYVMVVGFAGGILLTALAWVQHQQITDQDQAVIITERVEVLSGPSTRETVSFTIHEGITCKILDRTEGWLRIRLANGYNGWVRQGDLEVI